MQQAIDYLKRLRELSRREAEGYDADFPEQKGEYSSVYWSDYYAYGKVIRVLEAAPEEPEARGINLGAFRDAVKAAMEKAEIEPEKVAPLCSAIIGALTGARIGRKIDAETPTEDKED